MTGLAKHICHVYILSYLSRVYAPCLHVPSLHINCVFACARACVCVTHTTVGSEWVQSGEMMTQHVQCVHGPC